MPKGSKKINLIEALRLEGTQPCDVAATEIESLQDQLAEALKTSADRNAEIIAQSNELTKQDRKIERLEAKATALEKAILNLPEMLVDKFFESIEALRNKAPEANSDG